MPAPPWPSGAPEAQGPAPVTSGRSEGGAGRPGRGLGAPSWRRPSRAPAALPFASVAAWWDDGSPSWLASREQPGGGTSLGSSQCFRSPWGCRSRRAGQRAGPLWSAPGVSGDTHLGAACNQTGRFSGVASRARHGVCTRHPSEGTEKRHSERPLAGFWCRPAVGFLGTSSLRRGALRVFSNVDTRLEFKGWSVD